MSTTVAIVTALSFLLGLVNQGISSGTILGGLFKVPPAWLPYLTIVGSFLGGAVASLNAAPTVDVQALTNALVAGILALSAAGGGTAVLHHVGQPARTMALKAGKPTN